MSVINIDKKSNYQIVMVDNPLKFMHIPEFRDFFGKVLKLKSDGFRTLETGYLAIDTTDTIGTHLLVCEQNDEGLEPLLCTKAITKNDSKFYNLPFGGYEMIKKANIKEHLKAIESFIETVVEKTGDVAYTSSFTMAPRIRDRRARASLLRLFLPLVAQYHYEFDTPFSFCVGRLRTKANTIIQKIGYEPLSLEGRTLPAVPLEQLMNDDFEILTFENPSQDSLDAIVEYQNVWDQRIVVSKKSEESIARICKLNHRPGHKIVSLPQQAVGQ